MQCAMRVCESMCVCHPVQAENEMNADDETP